MEMTQRPIWRCSNDFPLQKIEEGFLSAIDIQRARYASSPTQCRMPLLQQLVGAVNLYHIRDNFEEKCRELLFAAVATSDACRCNRQGTGHTGIWRHANILKLYAQCLVRLSLSDEAHEVFRRAVAFERRHSRRMVSRGHEDDQNHLLQTLRDFGYALLQSSRDEESWDVIEECVSIGRSFCRTKHDHNDHLSGLVSDLEVLASHPLIQTHVLSPCDLLDEGVRLCQDALHFHTERDDNVNRDTWRLRYKACLRKSAAAFQQSGRLDEACVAIGKVVSLVRSEEVGDEDGLIHVKELADVLNEVEALSAQAGDVEKSAEARREKEYLRLTYNL